ncbi:MAG: capreomycidine synthase [Scytonema sp. CRU_2_7]|nr:capreomycidine synthase [Scytonema sp. CRU_2_7]
MKIAPARLENWMNDHYYANEVDLGSSGVEVFSLKQLREMIGLEYEDLDNVTFHDSWPLGVPTLREAMAQRWGSGNPQEVMVTHGSSEAIFLVMHALLQEGDEVVVLEPCYQQLFSIAESIGCKLIHWQLRFEQQFAADLDEFKRLISPKTRMVVVNFPHNPTGISITMDEQKELIEAIAKVDAYLFWDGAFSELTYDALPLQNPRVYYDLAISIGTFSKAYGLPGLRIGWCFASPEILDKLTHIRNYITLHVSPLVELVAEKAVKNADTLLHRRLYQARNNLAILEQWILQHSDEVAWVKPQGGVCSFPKFLNVDDIETVCKDLSSRHKMLLVPGICFGYKNHVRLGFGCSTAELEKGLLYLSDFLTSRSLTPG